MNYGNSARNRVFEPPGRVSEGLKTSAIPLYVKTAWAHMFWGYEKPTDVSNHLKLNFL